VCSSPDTHRTSLSSTTTTQILISWASSSNMSHHMLKSGRRLPIRMIPQCLRLLSALGLSVSFGPSSFRVSTSSSSSDILPSIFLWFVVSPLLNQVLAKKDYYYAVDLPHAQVVGSLHAEGFHLWCLAQPGTIHHQRARHHHCHGQSRGWFSIRRECRSGCQPILFLHLLYLD
jgi:hypothetical protein